MPKAKKAPAVQKTIETCLSQGHPPIYKTPFELQTAINEYFTSGVTTKEIIVGKGDNKKTISVPVPTITGLCYYLGFESRQSFYDNEKRDGFSYTVKRARLFIEKEYEEQLQTGNTIGAIFALKNFGWFDKQTLEHSGKDGGPIEFNDAREALIDRLNALSQRQGEDEADPESKP